jgi:hypothetical protein
MASRKEEKERLRKEREEREQQEQEKSARKKKRTRILIAAGVLVVALGIIGIVALSGGDKKPAAAEGLQETPGPWEPLTAGLEDRERALNLPALSEDIYHVHAQLKVFINGKPATVPTNIGIDQDKRFLSSLHTHDDKGIVHMEAVEPYPFTLGQFFTVWGVKFTETQIGAFRAGNGLLLETYVNGRKVPSGPTYRMKAADRVVVAFGKPGQAEKDFKPDASILQ